MELSTADRWKHTEGALFRCLVESVSDCAVFTIDAEGVIGSWNCGCERLLGYREPDIIGQSVNRILLTDDAQTGALHRTLKEVQQCGSGGDDCQILRHDGTRFRARTTLRPIADPLGNPSCIAVVIREKAEAQSRPEDADEQTDKASYLGDVSRAVIEAGSLSDMLSTCAQAAVRHLHVALNRIWLHSGDKGALELHASFGMYMDPEGPRSQIPSGKYIIKQIAEERKPHHTNALIDDPRLLDREWARREQITAYAGYPLIIDDRVIGVMSIFSRQSISHSVLEALAVAANSIAVGVERKVAEERSRQQQEWLAVTFASIGEAVITTDTGGGVTFLNGFARQLTGWTQSSAHAQPLETVFRILHEPTREPVASPMARVLQERQIVDLDPMTILLSTDGTETPIEASFAPILGRTGVAVGVVVVFRNVAERRRAERLQLDFQYQLEARVNQRQAQLQASEERFRVVVDAAPVGMVMIDQNGIICLTNAEARARFGFGPNELLGKSIETLVPERFRSQHVADRTAYFQAPRPRRIGRENALFGRRKDGSEFPAEIGLQPIMMQDGPFILASIIDVTARMAVLAELSASEIRFRQLADAMPQIVWTARPDGTLDYFNERWYEYTGLPRNGGSQHSWDPVLHPEDRQRWHDTWNVAVKAGQSYKVEYRFRDRVTGDYRWHLSRALPARDHKGAVVRWFGTSTDIDDQKQAEVVLRQSHDELEQRVQERTLQLTELNESLQREIEERRAAELRLQEHAEEIATLMEVLPVPVWIARDAQCLNIKGNLATYGLLGMRPGTNVSKSAPPAEQPTFRVFRDGREVAAENLPMQQAIATGGDVRNSELDLVFEDGSSRTIYGFATPLFDQLQSVRGCIGAFIDITERRQLEKRLRNSEERYRAVVEDQTEVVCRLRADGTFSFVNEVYCRTFGGTPDALIGKHWNPVAHPDDVERVERELTALSPDNPIVRVENRVFDSSGRIRWMEFVNRGFFSEDGELTEIQLVGRDVTQRVQAEHELRVSEERIRLAMEAAQVNTWEWDITREKITWSDNPKSCQRAGPAPFSGTMEEFRSLIHPDDRSLVAQALDDAFRQRGPYQVEFRMIRADGSVRWKSTRGKVDFDSRGRPTLILGVDVDITERKLAEDRIRISLMERETLLKEVHHRVKNNLQVISSLLHLQSLHTSDESSVELFRESQHRVRSMALVHERLYRSQDFARVDFRDYIESLANYLFRSYQVNADLIRLDVRVHGVRMPIDAAVPCGLLVNELISNCLKHAFQGRAEGYIQVELTAMEDGHAALSISDDGVGLPLQVNPDAAATFGMQLIAALVDQLHGRIHIERQPGTQVRIIFPLEK